MSRDAGSLVADAEAEIGRGAIGAAVALVREALTIEDLPEAHELLGALAYADDDMDVVCREWVAAVSGYRGRAQHRDAARVATRLGEVHWSILGNTSAGRGWLERARRFLDEEGPCVEWGYLELALIACDRPDVDDLLESAERARRIAVEHHDAGLEVRALADGGLALVSQGRIVDGFRQLDEALAALAEVEDRYITGTTLCALLSSCDRAGDVSRAAELVRMTNDLVLGPNGGRPRVLGTHCNVAYGGVLFAAGRWPEAEQVILEALGPTASVSVIHRVDASARLAEIRVHQGRIDEAAVLLEPYEGHVGAGGALALVHAARDEHELARAVLRRTLTRLVGDVARGAPLLAQLVDCELTLGAIDGATDASIGLDAMARSAELAFVSALADQARGRVALATDDAPTAVRALEAARDRLSTSGRPFVDVTVQLDLSQAYSIGGDRAAAVDAARVAHAAAVQIGARALRDRAAGMLRTLGASAPRPAVTTESLADLTARELEVLDGVRRGETNAEIAARLYLSPRTVEHHVGRVLSKLGVRTRAEAAVAATAARIAQSGVE